MFDIKKFLTEASTGTAREIELEAHKIEGAMRTLIASLRKLEGIAGRSIALDARQLQLQATSLSKRITKLVDRIEAEHREN